MSQNWKLYKRTAERSRVLGERRIRASTRHLSCDVAYDVSGRNQPQTLKTMTSSICNPKAFHSYAASNDAEIPLSKSLLYTPNTWNFMEWDMNIYLMH